MTWLLGLPALLKRIPWQAYAIAAALLVAFLWHRAETKEAYRDGQANVWAQVEKAEAAQRERERAATAKLELAKRLEAQEAAARTQEINDAVSQIPDQAPSARQRAIACVSLQQERAARGEPAGSC